MPFLRHIDRRKSIFTTIVGAQPHETFIPEETQGFHNGEFNGPVQDRTFLIILRYVIGVVFE